MRSRAVPTWRIYLSARALSFYPNVSAILLALHSCFISSASRVFLSISSQLSSTLPLSRHSVKAREGEWRSKFTLLIAGNN